MLLTKKKKTAKTASKKNPFTLPSAEAAREKIHTQPAQKNNASLSYTEISDLEKRNEEYIANKYNYIHEETELNIGHIGLLGSTMTIIRGAGNACSGLAANPLIIGVGVLLGAASLGYMLWKYLS